VNGNPFAVIGADYSQFNTNGELDIFDAATGKGQLTNFYLADRSEFLANLLYANAKDTTDSGTNVQYVDMTRNITLNEPLVGNPSKKMVFGTNKADSINGTGSLFSGDNVVDRLYGMAGNDTLDGFGGNDYLEGGIGDDFLIGGKGDDILNGGKGNDTYLYQLGDGNDTIMDSDGKGRIVITDAKGNVTGVSTGDFSRPGTSGNVWKNSSGTLTLSQQGATWTLTLSDGGTITLGDSFKNGDFGINLVDATPANPNPGPATKDIVGDPLIHSATIAPGGQGPNWSITKAYNFQYTTDANGKQTLVSEDVDYFLMDSDGNPTEPGGPARDDRLNDLFVPYFGDKQPLAKEITTGKVGSFTRSVRGGRDLIESIKPWQVCSCPVVFNMEAVQ